MATGKVEIIVVHFKVNFVNLGGKAHLDEDLQIKDNIIRL